VSEKRYSTNLSISIGEIKASSEAEAEAIMDEFIDTIGPVMADKISWDSISWIIQEDIVEIEDWSIGDE
jgi:hypothetical protein